MQIISHHLSFVIFLVFFATTGEVQATHIRAGEITFSRSNCNNLTFEITFTGYRDTGSIIIFGDGFMDFGDGSDRLLIKSNEFTATFVGNEIERNVVTITHTFPAMGLYTVGYRELNRNAGTLNIDNSVDTPFYTESQIVIDAFIGCNQSPKLLIPPVDTGCTQVAFLHNPGAFDPDGDSLSYEFVVPKQDRGIQVAYYRDPNTNEAGLYPNGYNTANEKGNGPPAFTINSRTGDVIWDAPGAEGQYNIAFRIIEWRFRGGKWIKIGYVTRDMQILINDCDNKRPELDIPLDICVEAGALINETITGTDPDNDLVRIEVFSQLFNGSANQPVFTPDRRSADFRPVPAMSQFRWQTTCKDVREQPYQVIFKITDRPPLGPRLVTFATWNITVTGAKPDLRSATRDKREAILKFSPYDCNFVGEPIKIQIWRRVASYGYAPDKCQTGLPQNSGYQLIDETQTSTSQYRDTNRGEGLAFGAQYCYRLIAVFPKPQGGESIVSDEMCIDPVEVTAPIITHVSVLSTDKTTGKIKVKWRSPFDLNVASFDPPLRYRISRATDLSPATPTVIATVANTTYTDTRLNTSDNAYHYTITAIDNSNVEIATSIAASSVWIQPASQSAQIALKWTADVPWSNVISGQPHELYRNNIDVNDPTRFVKIAEVDVTKAGFRYTDTGKVNDTPLNNTQPYCYYVITKGSYGNPRIATPQLNGSQVACGQPGDDTPPCAIKLSADVIDCRQVGDLSEGDYPFDDLPCGFSNFKNTLTWNQPGICGEDIDHYDIYYKSTLTGKFVKTATVKRTGTEYVHHNLPSYAGCYVVKSVDRSGNESEFSNEVCKDNCPNYVLPNVFTPNNDHYNDTFRAYGNVAGSMVDDRKTCPRFVQSVKFRVFNIWGREVFTYNSDQLVANEQTAMSESAILINWNGNHNNGHALAVGVYFYSAEVVFDVINPEHKTKVIKGWVHLLR